MRRSMVSTSAGTRSRLAGAQVDDLDAVLRGQAVRDQRAMARLWVAFNAHQRRRPVGGQLGYDRVQVGSVEDLGDVAVAVLARQLAAGAFADSQPVVLAVLQPAQFGRGRQLLAVAVLDAGPGQRSLQPNRVRPRVVAAAHAAPLAYVQQQAHAGPGQALEERLSREAVDADGRDRQDSEDGSTSWRVR